MKELETLKLYRGATSVIELDFTGFTFKSNSYCQLTIKKKYNDDIIFQYDFNKSIKYYVTFKDEFTAGLDDDKYKYDIMYMLNDERYPQCSISDIIIDEVVNNYVGDFNEKAISIVEKLIEGVEITQSIKVTTANVIITDANLQEKTVTPSLEDQIILSEEGFDGLSKVIVEGVNLETKTISPNRDTQIITPNEALGLSSVTIEPVSLESKSVVPSKEVQTLNPSGDFVGFSKVLVEAIPEEYIIPNGNLDIKNNGNYDVKDNATVNVNVQPNLQEKEARVTAPVNAFIHPDEDYDGLAFVNVIATVGTEQVEVTPTKEVQNISRSEGKYIESVIVNPIPDNYIEPSGELEITENGDYDVIDKASVKVDVQPNLGTKTITENGVYNASDDNLDGYSSVEVETSGADLNEYFTETISKGSSTASGGWMKTIKKLPKFTISGTSCNYMFSEYTKNEIDLSNFDTSDVTTMTSMFSNCTGLVNLDLSNFDTSKVVMMLSMFQSCTKLSSLNLRSFTLEKNPSLQQMFYNCTSLKHLDIRNFDFTNITKYTDMFDGVPVDCEIIVKDDTAKTWVLARRSDFTNVKTVAELGA